MEQSSQPPSPHGTPLLRITALLLFAFLIAALSSLGTYYFLQNQQIIDNPESESIYCTLEAKICPDGSSVGRVPPSCEFEACPNKSTKTFEIREVGIKFEVPQKLADLKYVVKKSDGFDESYVYFSTDSLMKSANNIGGINICNVSEGPLGALTIITTQKPTNAGVFKKIGGLYYNFSGPQATCSSDKNVVELQTSQKKLLQEAILTLELK